MIDIGLRVCLRMQYTRDEVYQHKGSYSHIPSRNPSACCFMAETLKPFVKCGLNDTGSSAAAISMVPSCNLTRPIGEPVRVLGRVARLGRARQAQGERRRRLGISLTWINSVIAVPVPCALWVPAPRCPVSDRANFPPLRRLLGSR